MKEVTIVIPVYNRSEYLDRLFSSITLLQYTALKVILVDNASTDDSLARCRQFAETCVFPVQVLEEPRKGAGNARNTGLQACDTEWVYFFDSDDELSADFLNVLMPLTTDKDVVLFSTTQVQGEHHYTRPFRPTCAPSYQILSSMLNTQSMLFRSSWLKSIGGWNTSLTVWIDWELGIRVLLNQPRAIWYTQHPFHHIYIHSESITGADMTHNLPGKIECLKMVYNELTSPQDKKALYYRSCIVQGQVRRLGGSFPLGFIPWNENLLHRLMGRALSFYTSIGGRGAWRLATALL